MAFPTAGAIVELALEGTLDAQRVMNLLHYRVSYTSGGPAGEDELFNALHAAITPTGELIPRYLACISTDFTLDRIRYQVVAPTRTRFRYKDMGITGTGGAPACPPADSACITLRGDGAGRTNRRSLHLPGLPFDWVNQGKVDPGFLTNFANLRLKLEHIYTVLTTVDLQPCIWHRTNYVQSVQIKDSQLQDSVRTMRRRVLGRGI
jgi:hypothetical protein